MNINLNDISTSQLKQIRQILAAGALAQADKVVAQEQLCHKSPPKGYPKEKSDYGDPECYRYPLNTKARCLAAWRYVHQADNKSILGKKFSSVESKIKNYAKKHYNLDLQTSESEVFDWSQAFVEYYDSETMGERCECIILDEVKETMDNNEKVLEQEIATLKSENESLKSVNDTLKNDKVTLEEKASQVETLTQELDNMKVELEELRNFKLSTEKAAERAERIKNIKSKLQEAGIESDLDDDKEATYWLNMSEEVFSTTILKMGDLKKGADATASIKVPQVGKEEAENPIEIVRTGLRNMREKK